MSKVTSPIMTDETGKDIAEKLHTLNILKGIEVGSSLEKVTTMQEIRRIVAVEKRLRMSSESGDRSSFRGQTPKPEQNTLYTMDVIKIANVTSEGWIRVSGLYLQWHYATPVRRTVPTSTKHLQSRVRASGWHLQHSLLGQTGEITVKANETYQFTD
ncbi:MAG: hypothetical protein ACLS61_07520 [Ruminococcus sp.]